MRKTRGTGIGRRLTAVMLAAAMCTAAAGCGERSSGERSLLTIDVYDVAANVDGPQTGWFGELLRQKFNIELHIIAPQVTGADDFQTRFNARDLGDIVVLENSQLPDCIYSGLVRDIHDKMKGCENLERFADQIETYNEVLLGEKRRIYGIPCQMMDTSPSEYSSEQPWSLPMLRWDLYNAIGAPQLGNLDDLLDALEEIHRVHPLNAAGENAWPLSLWADWDGADNMIGMANVVQLTTWYGEKVKGSAILRPDDTFLPLTDRDGAYYKILRFLNAANRRGLVDPASGKQNWQTVNAKISGGCVDLLWYNWSRNFWNTQERYESGEAFMFIPIGDQRYYADGDTYYGSGRVFAVGGHVKGEKYDRIMEFLDWYASPEGLEYQHDGIRDFNYAVGGDGRYVRINTNAVFDNLPVPGEYGGEGYADGANRINQWIADKLCTDPNTGEPYDTNYWSSYRAATATDMTEAWRARFGAETPTDYMKLNGVLLVSPNTCIQLPVDTAEIDAIRQRVNQAVCDASWEMVFAEDEATFEALWDAMTDELEGLGVSKLYQADVEKYRIEVEAKNAG